MHKSNQMLYGALKKSGIDFYVSVPCSYFAGIINSVNRDQDIRHVSVTREEEGVGVLVGAFLAGRRPAMILQNSGLGNMVNAIASLSNFYQIPLVFLVSHRGTSGEKIEAQNPMGRLAKTLLRELDVDVLEVNRDSDAPKITEAALEARERSRSLAILVPISFWEPPA